MHEKSPLLSRRNLLHLGMGIPLAASVSACLTSGTRRVGKAAPKTKLNTESYWARREAWTGEEWVFGVVEVGDRILMVKHKNELGWGFPGGIVRPFENGEKNKNNDDLIKASTVYVHNQALIPVLAGETIALAYGYVIDERRNKVILVHWMNVFSLSDYLPTPQANMNDVTDARWAAVDDPELGEILQMRLNEIKEAGEGKTMTLHSAQV